MVMLAGSIGATLMGSLYAGATAERSEAERAAAPAPMMSPPRVEPIPPPAPPAVEPLAVAIPDTRDPLAVAVAANAQDLVDEATGLRIGPLTLIPRQAEVEVEEAEATEAEATEAETEEATDAPPARRRARATRTPRPPPGPRLHPDPGMHVILTARGMMRRGEVIQGSCYRYISEVYDRAGHSGWRNRRTVYQGNRNGPYASLDLVRPGDWLYIVNHPDRTPVGTHSVLFVGWQDRARGEAHVIEHSGWGAPSAGQERTYNISRTYRITRPTLRR